MLHNGSYIALLHFGGWKVKDQGCENLEIIFGHDSTGDGPLYFMYRPQCSNSGGTYACCALHGRFSCLLLFPSVSETKKITTLVKNFNIRDWQSRMLKFFTRVVTIVLFTSARMKSLLHASYIVGSVYVCYQSKGSALVINQIYGN